VRRAADGSVAYTGSLGDAFTDADSQLPVQAADFSSLREPGEYYVEVPGVGRSVTFRIGDDVYDGELANVMLGFYGWRSGIPIAFDYQGVHFEHAAGHLGDALLDYVDGQEGVRKDGTGGWYDAGDYGKYLPTASESVVTLLAAWELFSKRLEHLELPFIPEHGGPLPDYLSEIKWELDWLLKMTYDDGSGRVHHKINSPSFPGFVLPADDPTTRYFSTYSTGATAELVATLAKAARAFAPYDDDTDGYSEKLLDAAWTSYAYLQDHPENVQYDASVLAAGSYQKTDVDDRLWAAAELWETTGDEDVLADLEERLGRTSSFVQNFDWDTTANFGLLTYALSKREGRDPELLDKVRQDLDRTARALVISRGSGGYGRDLKVYYWGTNGVIARTCMLLQAANALAPNPDYLDTCADQIGYLYGRNQYNRSQVTGSGIAPPLHPHHRLSGADSVDPPYPGLLVGGGQTATSWADSQDNFSSNEVAINWNSALAYALAGFYQGEGESSLGRGPVEAADCGVRVNSIGYVPGRAKVATVQTECELPSSFQCTLGENTLSGDTSGPPSVIDDLEDGDTQISSTDGRQGAWFVFDDGTAGSRPDSVQIEPANRASSQSAACISGQGFTGWGGGIGFSLAQAPGAARGLYDASGYTGITFWARGTARQFRVLLVDEFSDPAGGKCTSCYDDFQAPFTPSDEWQQFTFDWTKFKQQMFGDPEPNVCASKLYAIQFQWSGSAPFELCLDDVAFTQAPKLTIPAPPPASATAEGSGCGCRWVARSTSGEPLFWAAPLGFAFLIRRRRRAGTLVRRA
jgi:endoglucanase